MPSIRNWRSGFRYVLFVLLLAALYVVTARLGLMLALPPEKKATAIWPPSGIAFAAVLLMGRRAWPGIWLGAFLANFWDFFSPGNSYSLGSHLLVCSGIAVGSTLQPLLGAFLLRRWSGPGNPLDRGQSVFQLMGIAALMCFVSSTIGVGTLCLSGFAPWSKFQFSWWTWWLGDTLGVFLVTPLILAWTARPTIPVTPRRLTEAVLLLGVLLVVCLSVFGEWSLGGIGPRFLAYMTVPPLVWAAYRFGQHGATTALVFVSGMAIWGVAHSHGPFVRETLNESLLVQQTFIGVLTVTTLALAGVLSEREQAEMAQARLIDQFQRAVNEIRVSELLEEQLHRIARELHDEAGQLLASVHLALHDVARDVSPSAQERLLEIRALLDRIELQLRRLSHELRPTILDDLGLFPALQFLSEGVSQRSGVEVTVEGSTRGRLPSDVETALYRIVQEALNNAVRHAGASRVTIGLRQGVAEIRCSIRDDGVGFPTDGEAEPGRQRGLGLVGIRERVAALSGNFVIHSSDRRGTEVLVILPLENGRAGTDPAC